jgi:hypothetical protein
MEIPEGIDPAKEDYLSLIKTVNCLVQSAR